MESTVLLEAKHIVKSFSGITVLNDVELMIRTGEVHALVGENGAGKSTLIKILTGALPRDSGQIFYQGREVKIHTRHDAQRLGIAVIFQELSLIPTLTVAENILLGNEPVRPGLPLLKRGALRKQVQALIERYQFPLNANAMIESLSIAQRQLVEILKALSLDASLIIMDEPTASLSTKETEHLFEIIQGLRSQGVSILYISHRMAEVHQLANYITILRDGEYKGTFKKDDIRPEKVIQLMIGKDIAEDQVHPQLTTSSGPPILELNKVSRTGVFSEVSFQLHQGEILGLGGLVGSGRTEILRAIFGADRIDQGEILFDGRPFSPSIPRAIQAGMGFIPEDRRIEGFIPLLSVEKNIALTNYDRICPNHLVTAARERGVSHSAIQNLHIRPPDPKIIVNNLSGGNQQKVVLAKWLARDLKVLLVDEPTAGIDVGAKEEIYTLLESLAAQGVGIILVSSDLSEFIRLSHRILVLHLGTIVQEFDRGTVTEEAILTAASWGNAEEGGGQV